MVQGLEAKTFGRRYYFEKEEIFDWEMAVLVAVSIPIFTAQLEKSRESTDLANLRAAKAAGVTAYLDNEYYDGTEDTETVVRYYNIIKGVLEEDDSEAGKGTAIPGSDSNTGAFVSGDFSYDAGTAYAGSAIKVTLDYGATAAEDAVVVEFE